MPIFGVDGVACEPRAVGAPTPCCVSVACETLEGAATVGDGYFTWYSDFIRHHAERALQP